jgi:tetratricopeptide (TPR) repeat protein
MRRLALLASLAALLGAPAAPSLAALDAGTEPAIYLGTGAKAAATGRSAATDGGVAAMDWNPAGLAQVPRFEALVQHAVLFGGAAHDTLAVAYPVLDWGTWAAGWMRVELGGVERRDADNLPGGSFGFREQEFLLAYGREVWGPLALGATFKLHDLRLDGLESWSPGVDAGAQVRCLRPFSPADGPVEDLVQELRLGAAVRNAAAPLLKLKDEAERLRPAYRFGAAVVFDLLANVPDALTLKVDAEKPELAEWRWHVGGEYSLYDHFALRGGWDQEYLSAGAGLAYGGMELDYAVSFPVIGLRHLVTLTFAFGEDLRDVRARRQAEEERQRQTVVDKLKQDIIQGYDQKARELAAAGKYPEAVKLWEKVLDWDPNDRETQENLRLAREEVRKQEIADLLDQGEKAFQEERYVDTMLACRQVQELEPKHPQAAELYDRAEKKATTLGELAFAKEAKAMIRVRQHYMSGLKAYTQQDWGAAIQHWEQVLADSPLQRQVYMYLGKAKAQYEKVKQQRQSGTTLSPAEQKRLDMYKQAVSLSRAGKLKDAALTWEKIITENPEDADAKTNLDKTRKEFISSEKKGIRR